MTLPPVAPNAAVSPASPSHSSESSPNSGEAHEQPLTKGEAVTGERRSEKRWLASTGWLVLGRLVGSFCTFAILFQLARQLELSPFGRLTFYMALLAVLGSLVDLGTGQTIVRQSSREPDSLAGLLRTARRVRWFMATLCCLGFTIWAGWTRAEDLGWLIASVGTLYASVWELSNTPARNAMRLRAPVLIRASASILALAAVTGLLQWGERRVGPLLFVIVASAGLANLLQHVWLRKKLPQRPAASFPLRPYLRLTLPLGLGALCQQLYFWIDNAFILSFLGDEALGRYNLPVRLFSFAILVAVLAPNAALPHLARAHQEKRLGAVVSRMGLPLIGLGAFGAAILWVWTPTLLSWFGPEFEDSAQVMRILIVALWSVHAGALWMTALIAAGLTQDLLRLAATGLAVNLIGNAALLPLYGIEGAALATVGTEVWVAAWAGLQLKRHGAFPFSGWTGRHCVMLVVTTALGWASAWCTQPLLAKFFAGTLAFPTATP